MLRQLGITVAQTGQPIKQTKANGKPLAFPPWPGALGLSHLEMMIRGGC